MWFYEFLFLFSWQNTNGVNFYNILTQNPDESEKLSNSTGLICKAPTEGSQWSIRSSLLTAAVLCCFPSSAALQIHRHIKPLHRQPLSQLMNGPVREKLGIIPKNVTWGGTVFLTCTVLEEYLVLLPTKHVSCFSVHLGQAEEVFSNMAGDFMRPVVDVVDQLLNKGVNVTVYNGQLDLIVNTMGVYCCPQEQWRC